MTYVEISTARGGKGESAVPAKQRAVLLILVVISIVQQVVRWNLYGSEPALVQAAEAAAVEQGDRHCALVHVNTCGMAELQTLPGIGPVLAERIILERKEQPFREVSDLLRVSGIGEKRLAQIANLICLYFEDDAPTE